MLYFWWFFSSLAWTALSMLPDWTGTWARVAGRNHRPAPLGSLDSTRMVWVLGLVVIGLVFFCKITGIYPGEE
jgi:hypothetical protein